MRKIRPTILLAKKGLGLMGISLGHMSQWQNAGHVGDPSPKLLLGALEKTVMEV